MKCSSTRCTFAHSIDELVCMWYQILSRIREGFFCGKCLINERQPDAHVDMRCMKIYPDPKQLEYFHCAACGGPSIDDADEGDADDELEALPTAPVVAAAQSAEEGTLTGSSATSSASPAEAVPCKKKIPKESQPVRIEMEMIDPTALYKCASLTVWRIERSLSSTGSPTVRYFTPIQPTPEDVSFPALPSVPHSFTPSTADDKSVELRTRAAPWKTTSNI